MRALITVCLASIFVSSPAYAAISEKSDEGSKRSVNGPACRTRAGIEHVVFYTDRRTDSRARIKATNDYYGDPTLCTVLEDGDAITLYSAGTIVRYNRAAWHVYRLMVRDDLFPWWVANEDPLNELEPVSD